MTSTERFAVFGFTRTHDAMRAEEILLASELEVVLIPTPRVLGTLCGLAARVPCAQCEEARQTLAAAGIAADGEMEIADRVLESD